MVVGDGCCGWVIWQLCCELSAGSAWARQGERGCSLGGRGITYFDNGCVVYVCLINCLVLLTAVVGLYARSGFGGT